LSKAIEKGLFARAFKSKADAPRDLVDRVAMLLEKRALDALGLARREGLAVAGFDQVKAALSDGAAAVVISAADAADGGADKLSRLAGDTPRFRAFDVAGLSAALGKEGVRHAAVAKGLAAERFLRDARRLTGVMGRGTDDQSVSPADN
jgi:hypothetical protein